jgi:putative inorganic carbon (HCO3(-)) transporter
MRASILYVIVMLLCIGAVFRPRWGLHGYVWFSLMRPDYLAFATKANLSFVLASVVLVSSIRLFITNFALILNPLSILMLLLQLPAAISTLGAPLPDRSWLEYTRFARMCLMFFIVPMIVVNLQQFRALFLVMGASMGFLGLYWGVTAGLHGSRIFGGPGGFMSDNNSFAVGLSMILPFLWYGRLLAPHIAAKIALTAMAMGSIIAIVLTYSRGGAITCALVILMLLIRSQHKVITLFLISFLILPVLLTMNNSYTARISTISTYDQDQSAMSRFVQMHIAWELWKSHKVWGIGMGNEIYLLLSRPYLGENDAPLIVHNSFLQILVHTGIFGFLIWMAMLVYSLWICWSTSRALHRIGAPEAMYPYAILASLVAYCVASIAHPRATFDFYYLLLMCTATWNGIYRREIVPKYTVAVNHAPRAVHIGRELRPMTVRSIAG